MHEVGRRFAAGECLCIVSGQLLQRSAAGGTEQQRVGLRLGCFGTQGIRQGFDDHVAVGAANAERGHTGPARAVWPVLHLHRYIKRTVFKFQRRVGPLKVQAGRNTPVADRQHRFDQAGNAGGSVQVAEIALDRAQCATGNIGAGGEHLPQRLHFNGIAQWRRGAVGFEHADTGAVDIRQLQGIADHLALADDRRCAVTDLVLPVIVDRTGTQHRQHRVTVTQGVFQAAQGHRADAIAGEGALSAGIERAAATVGRKNHARLIPVAGLLRERYRHPAGHGHAALTTAQAFAGHMHRHQGAGTGGLHRDGRAAQVELVSGTGGQVILVVTHQRLQAPDLGHLGDADLLTRRVGTHAGRGEHAGLVGHLTGREACVLQSVPDGLQEQPLLGVDGLGLLARIAEQGGVELVGGVDHRRHVDEVRMVDQCRFQAGGQQFLTAETAAALAAGQQVLPVFVTVAGAGKTAGQADHRDGFAGAIERFKAVHA